MSDVIFVEQQHLLVASDTQPQVVETVREVMVLAAAEQGPPGRPGADGPPGTGLAITGVLSSPDQLPVPGQLNDAYLIGGDLWVWVTGTWHNAGPFQGPPGPSSEGALLIENRLSELSLSPQAQADARANIGLAVIDGGTFN